VEKRAALQAARPRSGRKRQSVCHMEVGHYHFRVSVGDRRDGGRIDASLKYQYNSRSGRYSELNAKRNSVHGTGEQLTYTSNGNLPSWAKDDPDTFWRASQEFERKNGTQFREFEGSLPRGLTPTQQIEIVEKFVKEHLSLHVHSLAIHSKKQSDGLVAQHVHIQISERVLDGIERDPMHFFKRYNGKNPEIGGCKKDSMGTPERLMNFRASWAQHCNEALASAGRQERVDHRSYRERGIDLAPEKKLSGKTSRKLTTTQRQDIFAARTARREFLSTHYQIQSLIEREIMWNTLNTLKNIKTSPEQLHIDADGTSNNVFYIKDRLKEAREIQSEVAQLMKRPVSEDAKKLGARLIKFAKESEEQNFRRRKKYPADTSISFEMLREVIEGIRNALNLILKIFGLQQIPPLFPADGPSVTSNNVRDAAISSPVSNSKQKIDDALKEHSLLKKQFSSVEVHKKITPHQAREAIVEKLAGADPEYKKLLGQEKALISQLSKIHQASVEHEAALRTSHFLNRFKNEEKLKLVRASEAVAERKLDGVQGKIEEILESVRRSRSDLVKEETDKLLKNQEDPQRYRDALNRRLLDIEQYIEQLNEELNRERDLSQASTNTQITDERPIQSGPCRS